MTIPNRLKFIVLVPIILLLALVSYFFIISYVNFEKAKVLKTVLENNAKLSPVLTEAGKERGLTLMRKEGEEASLNSLLKQSIYTDSVILEMKKDLIIEDTTYVPALLGLFGTYYPIDTASYKTLLSNIEALDSIRIKATTPESNFQEIFFKEFNQKISSPLWTNLLQIRNLSLDIETSSLISILSQLYTVKENSGLERDLVSCYITKQVFMPHKEIALWNKLKAKANVFDITRVNNHKLRQSINAIFENPKNVEILTKLSEVSTVIKSNTNIGEYQTDVMDWFSLQTQKISLLTKAEFIISNALWEKTNIYQKKQLSLLAISVFIFFLLLLLAYLGYKSIKNINSNVKELESILNNALDERKNSKKDLNTDIEKIELSNQEGTKKAYKFIENLVETSKEHKLSVFKTNEAKSLFLANMSQEIRTPLNGIAECTEILRSTNPTEEQSQFLSIIDKNSENLLNISNNVLDLSKIESNKVELEHIVFNPSEEFESVIETYALSAAEKNIDLDYYIDPAISKNIKGDPAKIKVILMNLISNAIKFTSKGGEVNLVIKKVQTKNDLNPKILFLIQDNGIGIADDQQSHIFEVFSQADASLTRKNEGIGLGLTISSKYVELMGGKLEFESVKNKGTSFFFSLQLEEIIPNDQTLKEKEEKISLEIQEPKTPNITMPNKDIDVNPESSTADTSPSTDILIAKKFLLERKILTKVLDNLGYHYSILESLDTLEEKVQSGQYKILFTDVDLLTDTIKTYSPLKIVTTSKTKKEINALIQTKS